MHRVSGVEFAEFYEGTKEGARIARQALIEHD